MNERAELAEEAKNKMNEGLIKIIDVFKVIINDNVIDYDLCIKLKQLHYKIFQLHDYQKKKDAKIIHQILLVGDPSMRITTNNNNDEYDGSLDSSIEESKELQDMENEIKSLQSEKEQLLKLLEKTQMHQ
ncbi:hypothetical protein HCN44_000468 [Aphidius gifuensis]|uniref:Uncharacterized protein n=1 Tax=Aphidius gifuensis TaxID=684658 RepID=A0A835CQX5_APHGI|nr:hypothetical protein HCN44_000468 [Aphidius gifuensis]